MNYILLHKSYGSVSMEMTQDKMEQDVVLLAKKNSGGWVSRYKAGEWTPAQIGGIITNHPIHHIINWGNHIYSDDSIFSLNAPSGIAAASDKAQARRILRAAQVRIPNTFFLNENWEGSFPIVARPPHHHGGQHFHIINTVQDLVNLSHQTDLSSWYFAEIFQKTHEFRVHVGHGKVLFVQEKPLVDGEIRANQAVNHESWRVLKWSEYNHGLCRESIRAIEALNLDYGAVDIMYNAADNSWAVCEVNTSPSINTPYSSEKYAAYFDWVIRHDFPAWGIDESISPVFYSALLRE
jgi:hypothetical protein